MRLKPEQDHQTPRSLSQRLNELLDKLSRWLKAAVSLEQPRSPNDVDAIILEDRVLYSGTPLPVDAPDSGAEANLNADGLGTPIPEDIWEYIESLNPVAGSGSGAVQQQDANLAEDALGSLVPKELGTSQLDQDTTSNSLIADSDTSNAVTGDLVSIDDSSGSEDSSALSESILTQALALQAEISVVEGASLDLAGSTLNPELPSGSGLVDTPADALDSPSDLDVAYATPLPVVLTQANLIEPYQVLGDSDQQLSSISNLVWELEWDHIPAEQLMPGYDIYFSGDSVGGWMVEQGSVDLLSRELLESPLSKRCIDLGGTREINSIACEVATEIGRRYQLTYSVTGNWLSGDALNGVLISADDYAEHHLLRLDPNASLLTSPWATKTFSFVANSERTRLAIGTIGEDVRGAIVSDLNLIEVPDYLSRALDENPTLGFDANRMMFFEKEQSITPLTMERVAGHPPSLSVPWEESVQGFLAQQDSSQVVDAQDNLSAVDGGTGRDEGVNPNQVSLAFSHVVSNELIIVDTSLPEYERLLSACGVYTSIDQRFDILYLDHSADGIAVVTEYLSQSGRVYDAIHLVTHGFSGGLQLGSATVTAGNLSEFETQLNAWRANLSADADLLLYGCSIADTATGEAFVGDLSKLLDVDVAASADPTGAGTLGGDWDLE
ncbi:MAG: DUF4347 domain-containing protein, partial [Pirellula sp.]